MRFRRLRSWTRAACLQVRALTSRTRTWVRARRARGKKPRPEHEGYRRFRQAASAWANAMLWESRDTAHWYVPPERSDPIPVEYPVLIAWAAFARVVSGAVRFLAAPFGSYIALTISDTSLRAAVIRGSRVRRWAAVGLPPGTVRDGLVLGADAFSDSLTSLVETLGPGWKLKDRRVAVTVTGRNTVHGRFSVSAAEEEELEGAVHTAARERLAIRVGDLEFDWHASRLPKVQTEETREGSAAEPEDPDAPEEPVPTHDVYAMGLYRNALLTNLQRIANLGAQAIDIEPKTLALAAAVNEPRAIIVDVERRDGSVVIVEDGLPEVVRDIGLDPGLPADQVAEAIRDEVERSVGYHDSLCPDDPLTEDTPLFVTGERADSSVIKVAVGALSYERRDLPLTLRAPEGFSPAEFAASIGTALIGRRWLWQPGGMRLVDRPRFRFLPTEFRPREMPVKLVLAGATAAALILGLGTLYASLDDRMDQAGEEQHTAEVFETRVSSRARELRNAAQTRAEIETVSAQTAAALQATGAIRGLDRGFAMTLSEITSHRVEGVTVSEVDDDGSLIAVRATASSYDALLAYARSLEESGVFESVSIRAIGDTGARGAEPDEVPLDPLSDAGPSLTLELISRPDRSTGDPPPADASRVQAPSIGG